MAVFNSAVLTARGNELLVDAVAGDKIIFTRMVVGCGEYSDRERERNALERMASLKDVRQEFTFSAYKKVSEQCVLLTAVISNRELDYSYKITEIGIYGKRVGDEADFLCSIAVTKSLEESDTFPPYNGLQECQIVQDYYITISPDAEVSVNSQGACVLREEFELIKQTLSTELNNLKENKLDKNGDGSNLTITFDQARDRKNISSGSKLSVIMGIISKVIADLKTGAFALIINHLMATEEGGVLDARQGKVLKDMIDELKRALDSLKQSFRDGCKMIVDRLTALGYGPAAPQGPEQIVASINTMYEDRYNSGRTQGRNDVIADPGAYGISTGIEYNAAVTTSNVDGFSLALHKNESSADLEEVNQTANRNIELKAGKKILYAIDIVQNVYATASYEGRINGGSEWSIKTVEGEVIQSGATGGFANGMDAYGNADGGPVYTNNINVDLFETPFTTSYTYVILSMHTTLRASCGAKGSADGSVAYNPITAKYK